MSQITTVKINQSSAENLAGKYLSFNLGSEDFGIEIIKVREIIGYIDITAVPRMPDYIKGIINLRGSVIPVVDLRTKFNMPRVDVTEQTCIIVVQVQQGDKQVLTGIVIDQVSEVLDIHSEQIETAPHFDDSCNTDFILGMGKIGQKVKILLDIDKVLNSSELNILHEHCEG